MSEFLPVAPLDSLTEGFPVPVRLGDIPIALYLIDGKPYCTEDLCTHEDNYLSEGGFVDGEEVECAYHGARFNVKTGVPTCAPARYPVRTFPVQVHDGHVYVAMDEQ